MPLNLPELESNSRILKVLPLLPQTLEQVEYRSHEGACPLGAGNLLHILLISSLLQVPLQGLDGHVLESLVAVEVDVDKPLPLVCPPLYVPAERLESSTHLPLRGHELEIVCYPLHFA